MAGKRVLVTGATGLLGRRVSLAFSTHGWGVVGTGFSRADGESVRRVDLRDAAQVEKVLADTRPQVVVHCAANRFPDKVDKDPEGTRRLNIDATEALARLCATGRILLIYISTDYVFSGRPGEAPYEVDAPTGPTNLYGQTKLDGERAVLAAYAAAGADGLGVVLRVPVLYGVAQSPAESAVNVLLDAATKAQKEDAKIKMDHWSLRYPTNTDDVARVVHDVAVKYLAADAPQDLPRVLQFSSEDRFTKYEICQLFAWVLGVSIDGMEANTEGNDPSASVQRPYDCHLSTRALKGLGIDVATADFAAFWTSGAKEATGR